MQRVVASCWEWSSEGTSKGRHEFCALTEGRWERTAGSAERKKAVKAEVRLPYCERSPLGMEGASNRGGRGFRGCDPDTLFRSAQWQADGVKDALRVLARRLRGAGSGAIAVTVLEA